MSTETLLATLAKPGKYLSFALGQEEYGVEILKVQEIIGMMSVTKVPRTPDYVRGVVNLRGRVIPVIDLRGKFNMARGGRHREDLHHRRPGAAERIHGHHGRHRRRGLRGAELHRRPDRAVAVLRGGMEEADFITGMGKLGKKVVILLDVDRVMSGTEIEPSCRLRTDERGAQGCGGPGPAGSNGDDAGGAGGVPEAAVRPDRHRPPGQQAARWSRRGFRCACAPSAWRRSASTWSCCASDRTGDELVQLIDAVSTNVTHFFREDEHFQFLSEVTEGWARQGTDRLRIWSAACSTGEEPYSIAMTVGTANGRRNADIRILATDISTRVLAEARGGAVSRGAPVDRARGSCGAPASRRVSAGGETLYEVKPELRRLVMFRRLNFKAMPYPIRGTFDVIFCRNAMIYFDRPQSERMVRRVRAAAQAGRLSARGSRRDAHRDVRLLSRDPTFDLRTAEGRGETLTQVIERPGQSLRSKRTICVDISDMKLSRNREDVIVTYSLGSCVGLSLYDPLAGVGAHDPLHAAAVDDRSREGAPRALHVRRHGRGGHAPRPLRGGRAAAEPDRQGRRRGFAARAGRDLPHRPAQLHDPSQVPVEEQHPHRQGGCGRHQGAHHSTSTWRTGGPPSRARDRRWSYERPRRNPGPGSRPCRLCRRWSSSCGSTSTIRTSTSTSWRG